MSKQSFHNLLAEIARLRLLNAKLLDKQERLRRMVEVLMVAVTEQKTLLKARSDQVVAYRVGPDQLTKKTLDVLGQQVDITALADRALADAAKLIR